MAVTARELRGQQKVVTARLEQLTERGTFRTTPEQNAERELLIDQAERLKEKLARLEGRKIDTSALESRAFWRYLQNGLHPSQYFPGISAEERALLRNGHERRDMGEGLPPGAGSAFPGATAGFFVPTEFADQAEVALKHHSDFWATSRILNTRGGGVLGYPTVNDTTIAGNIIYEGVLNASNDVASIGQVSLGAYKWTSGMVRISLELVQDGGELFQQTLINLLMQRIARATTPLFTSGDGMSYMSGSPPVATPQPRGIMLDAVNSGVTPTGDDNAKSPDPSSQLGYLDYVAIEGSLDTAYRRRAIWMMHPTTLQAAKILKDKSGRPIWTAGMSDNAPADPNNDGYILGHAVHVNISMDQLAASNKPVVFYDPQKYCIRNWPAGMTVQRLEERFADYGQIAYIAYLRCDAALLDAGTHPAMYVQMAA